MILTNIEYMASLKIIDNKLTISNLFKINKLTSNKALNHKKTNSFYVAAINQNNNRTFATY